jgi:hypothetical protein
MTSEQTMLDKMMVLGEGLVKNRASVEQCRLLAKDVAKLTSRPYATVRKVLNAVLLMHGMPLI